MTFEVMQGRQFIARALSLREAHRHAASVSGPTQIYKHSEGGVWRRVKTAGKKKNPSMTKKQKRARAATSRKRSGIASAVRSLLKKTNPSARITGARVVKLRDGGLTIRPIKNPRGRR